VLDCDLPIKHATPDLVRFDDFEVDVHSREVRKNRVPIALQDQPFRILEILLSAAGGTVSREEIIAELWPSGTFVDFDRGLNTAINKLRAALGDSAEEPRFIESVGRHGYRFIGSRARLRWTKFILSAVAALIVIMAIAAYVRMKPATPIHSIAVLPLTNLSKSQEQEFFADGMTDQLITDLAKIRGLSVISHQSVTRFKASRASLKQIARELGVDALVEGSVVRSGSRVRVTAQLLDARTDRHLWASDYERDIGDVLTLQDDIAHDIAEQIGAKLTSNAEHTPKSDAYLLYLRGIYEWNKIPPNFDAAIRVFDESIRIDPRFARAYAGLADCYATRKWWTNHAADDAEHARTLALTALRLDPSLAEAYTTLGGLADDARQNDVAENNFQRALAANPKYIIAHQWYALHLVRFRRYDEALREARIAQKIDPLSPYAIGGVILVLDLSGKVDQALQLRRKSEMMFPDERWAPLEIARMLRATEHGDGAVSELIRGLRSNDAAPLAAAVEKEYQAHGADAALRVYARDRHFLQTHYWVSARFDAMLGDREAALDDLERSYAEGEARIVYANAAPEFASLHDDPRFRSLIAKLKLE
jgi:TolB-like protein/DNA-binding winged helix-turn-helix (wHTH) protein